MAPLRRALSSLKRRSTRSLRAVTPHVVTRFLFRSYDLRDWRVLNLGAAPAPVPIPVRATRR